MKPLEEILEVADWLPSGKLTIEMAIEIVDFPIKLGGYNLLLRF